MLKLNLQIIGGLILCLGLAHPWLAWFLEWKRETAMLSPLTRRIFFVHCFFIVLLLLLLGAGTMVFAGELLVPGRGTRALLTAIVVFWACRLVVQIVAYDPKDWGGRPLFHYGHVAFLMFWIYVVATYGAALWKVLV